MNPDNHLPKPIRQHPFSVFRNWISVSGLVMSLGGLFSFFLLLLLDLMAKQSNPYVGILTYMVAPAFIVGGLVIFVFGGWWRRRTIIKTTGKKPTLRIDFSLPKDRKAFALDFVRPASSFLFVSAIGSYQTYHFTESVQFCGQACHQVMKPELVTYLHGPHARVSCAECHIGKGAGWFVKIQAFRHLPGLRGGVQQVSPAGADAGQEPASGAGHLRAVPLAAETRGEHGADLQLLPDATRPIRRSRCAWC